jgi:hypothetical protein
MLEERGMENIARIPELIEFPLVTSALNLSVVLREVKPLVPDDFGKHKASLDNSIVYILNHAGCAEMTRIHAQRNKSLKGILDRLGRIRVTAQSLINGDSRIKSWCDTLAKRLIDMEAIVIARLAQSSPHSASPTADDKNPVASGVDDAVESPAMLTIPAPEAPRERSRRRNLDASTVRSRAPEKRSPRVTSGAAVSS